MRKNLGLISVILLITLAFVATAINQQYTKNEKIIKYEELKVSINDWSVDPGPIKIVHIDTTKNIDKFSKVFSYLDLDYTIESESKAFLRTKYRIAFKVPASESRANKKLEELLGGIK